MQKQIKAQIDRIVSEGAIYADARWYRLRRRNTLPCEQPEERQRLMKSGSAYVHLQRCLGFFSLFGYEQPAGSV